MDFNHREDFNIEIQSKKFGIRPQIINEKSLEFVNDFEFYFIDGNLHIINAVSPAFTSCIAISNYLISLI